MAPRRGARALFRSDHGAYVCNRPVVSCALGEFYSLQIPEYRSLCHRQCSNGCFADDSSQSQSTLDDCNGISADFGGVVAFPEIYYARDEPVRLRGVFEGSILLADRATVSRSRTSPTPRETHRQLPLLANLLAPAFGTKAVSSAIGLLAEFGSISGVAAAPAEALERVLGGDATLAAMLSAGRAIVHVGMREIVQRQRISCEDPALLNYLLAQFAGLAKEHLIVLFLDEKRGFLAEERFTSGSSNCLSFRPRELFGHALALDCRAILLAHNHPSGDPTPSQNDIDATSRIAADALGLEIELLDHLIVGQAKVVSMKRAGFL